MGNKLLEIFKNKINGINLSQNEQNQNINSPSYHTLNNIYNNNIVNEKTNNHYFNNKNIMNYNESNNINCSNYNKAIINRFKNLSI